MPNHCLPRKTLAVLRTGLREWTRHPKRELQSNFRLAQANLQKAQQFRDCERCRALARRCEAL